MLTGDIFIREGLITTDQLSLAQAKLTESGSHEPIARILVSMGLITEVDRVRMMGKVWGIPFIDLRDLLPKKEALELLSPVNARHYKALPFEVRENRLVVAMANPLDIFVIDELRLSTGYEIEPYIAVEEDLEHSLSSHYKGDVNISTELKNVMNDFGAEDVTLKKAEEITEDELKEEDAPVIRLANLIISQAIQDKVSDIHIEPGKDGLKVRYRIDGVMIEAMNLPKKIVNPLLSRFKIVANMDIAEKRVPQDNRISATIGGKDYDFRVSTLPLIHGEKIVMRVLDKGGINVGLSKLGFTDDNMAIVEDMCNRSYGIILVTGPTGSGKSTTLYSILNRISDGSNNIITIEDPVEYELGGINQCGVNVRAGMTFAAGLRAMLRQDPDVIMVGEMRDTETATIAMEAALTGHLVLSTLHTNDAPSAPTRLIDMEVEPFLIASSIICVLAQRLVRTVCAKCATEHLVPIEQFQRLGLPVEHTPYANQPGYEIPVQIGPGCEHCKNTGYKGRMGVHELMVVNDEIRDKILLKQPGHVLSKLALANNMKTLQMDAVTKVIGGRTNIDEVIRVLYA